MRKRFAATVLVIAVSLLGAAYRARAEGQVDPGYDAYSVTRYEGNRAIGAQGAAPSGPPGYGTAPVGDPGRSTAGYYGSAQAGSNGSGYGYGAPAGGAYGGAPSDPYATIRAGAAPGVDYRAPDTLGTGRNYYDDLYVRRRLVERYPVEREP